MFKVEINCDRAPERRRSDPVVSGDGVFGVLEPAELSAAEVARPAEAAAAEARRARRPLRLWLPEDVLKHLTMIYGRFANPFRRSGKRGHR